MNEAGSGGSGEPRWLIPMLAALLGSGIVAGITILLMHTTSGDASEPPDDRHPPALAAPVPEPEDVPEPVEPVEPVRQVPGLGWSAYRVLSSWGADQGWERSELMEQHGITGRRLRGRPVEYRIAGPDGNISEFGVYLRWHDMEGDEDNREIVVMMATMVATVSGTERDQILIWLGECAQDYVIEQREKTYTKPCFLGELSFTLTPSDRGTELALVITAGAY